MILKMNKFVIQWRQFESKRSFIFKDIDFLIFCIFLDFFRIYFDFNSFKKNSKRGLLSRKNHGMTWTCVDATWHTRPHGSATWTHASACVAQRWRRRVAGPRESTQMPGWCHVARESGWQVMGPRVSGPR